MDPGEKAKPDRSQFKLNYGYTNKDGLQAKALAKTDSPEEGSFGLYMQYSEKLPYILATSVENCPLNAKRHNIDLDKIGSRLPEFIVARMTNSAKFGCFKTDSELNSYIFDATKNKPLFLVVASGEAPIRHHTLNADLLVENLKKSHEKNMALEKRQHRIDRDYDLGR